MTELVLLPQPRQIELLDHAHLLRADRFILLDAPDPQVLRFAALRFQAALQRVCGLRWSLLASSAVPPEVIGLTLRLNPDRVTHPQGYELTIGPEQISIEAHDAAGVFYGVCTLIQILEGSETTRATARPAYRRLAGFSGARRDARHQPRSRADVADDVRVDRSVGELEDQSVSTVHRAHLCVSQSSRGVGQGVAVYGRGNSGIGCVLPRAPHRTGAESKFVRAHASLVRARALCAAGRSAGWLRFSVGRSQRRDRSACARSIPAA